MKRVIVPFDLGGSPVACALSTGRRRTPPAAVLEALIPAYREQRLPPHGRLEVGFFRGGLPSEELLAVARPHPVRLACSPADLDPGRIAWLAERGLDTLELEICTLSERVLWGLRRGYDGAQVRLLVAAARAAGLEVGLTLVPGLPGHTLEAMLEDARFAAVVDFVRIYPALALTGSDLATWAQQGRWQPQVIEDAVASVADMVEIVESAGTAVARIGYQPGPDGPEKVVAGPWHPNFRGLVETLRFRRRMAALQPTEGTRRRRKLVLRVNPKDLSWAKGTSNENVRWLRDRLRVEEIEVESDDSVERGSLAVGSGRRKRP